MDEITIELLPIDYDVTVELEETDFEITMELDQIIEVIAGDMFTVEIDSVIGVYQYIDSLLANSKVEFLFFGSMLIEQTEYTKPFGSTLLQFTNASEWMRSDKKIKMLCKK